jgi:DNA-binding NtrC family response regulator
MGSYTANIAVVDNRPADAEAIANALEEADDKLPCPIATTIFTNADDLIDAVEREDRFFDVILSDVFMPPREGASDDTEGTPEAGGIRVWEWLKKKRFEDEDFHYVQLRWVSAHDEVSSFLFDYSNIETESWMGWINHVPNVTFFTTEIPYHTAKALRMANVPSFAGGGKIVAASRHMQEAQARAEQVAKSGATVLIRGESGTGKELIAHAIHYNSPRAKKPFVPVNCGALPDALIESELFGYERGAFTGAAARKKGRFELAEGGTLLLDEIGELNLATQVKLLRVLQEREFERLGGTETIRADVRVIAATHRDLEAMVEDGRFRQDLYYRINVIPIIIPPLRERRDDVLALAEHFLSQFCQEYEKNQLSLTARAREALLGYDWPGNVRELENVIERVVVLLPRERTTVDSSDLRLPVSRPRDGVPKTPEEIEVEQIVAALTKARGVVRRAAKMLGFSRTTIYNKMNALSAANPAFADRIAEAKAAASRTRATTDPDSSTRASAGPRIRVEPDF